MKSSYAALLLLFLIAAPALAFARAPATPASPLAILSDVDDTVRPTGVKHPSRGLEVALGARKVKAFSGMRMLYEQLLLGAHADPTKDEYFVSGSPLTLSIALDPFLKANGFSTEHVEIRYFGPLRDIGKYKQGQFKKILNQNPKTSFIFFGDDTEKDAFSLAYAKDNFPKQVAGLYIHRVEGITPAIEEKGEIPYFAAVEIALHEMKKGRLTADRVDMVAQAMLDDEKFEFDVIPVYAKLCPDAGWISKLVADLHFPEPLPDATMDKIHDIEKRVGAICDPNRKPRDDEDDAIASPDPTPGK